MSQQVIVVATETKAAIETIKASWKGYNSAKNELVEQIARPSTAFFKAITAVLTVGNEFLVLGTKASRAAAAAVKAHRDETGAANSVDDEALNQVFGVKSPDYSDEEEESDES